jgi:hypothetical protein
MKKLFSFALFLIFGTVISFCQAGLGTLAGVVTDSTSAVVPGATVKLTGTNGVDQTTTTNSAGQYTFTSLPVGNFYTLTVTAPGFQHQQVAHVATSVGTTISQNVILNVGSESTTVEVQGVSVEQVQTDTSSINQLVDQTIWQNSPLSIRNQNDFTKLVAGATGTEDANTTRGAAINGARSGAGNYLVDGFDNNDQGQGGAGSTSGAGAVTTISPDAIQEYRIITSTPQAEYGRAGGFATDTVLKSGSRTWHGSAFEYNRMQALAANGFFSNRAGLRNHLVRNQFGGSLGGPVYKNRTFFYASAEFQRQSQGEPLSYVGVTQQFLDFVKSGNYQKFLEGTAFQNTATVKTDDGTTIDGEGLCPVYLGKSCPGAFSKVGTYGPVFADLYNRFPSQFPTGVSTSSRDAIGQGLYSGDGFYYPVPVYGQGTITHTTKFNQNRGTMKLDHKLTERDQLAFTYLLDLETAAYNNGGGDASPGPAYDQIGGSQLFGASWTHTFSPSLLNTFKASYLRHVSNFEAPGTLGIPSTYAADSLYTGFGATSGFPQLFTDNQFGYEDSVTKVLGRHTAKAGFRYVRTRNGSSFYNDVNGTLFHWSVEDLMTDGLTSSIANGLGAGGTSALYLASASFDPTTKSAPDPYRGYRANEFAAYLQDDWKVSPRLTLNYGVRWEYFGPPHNFKAGYDSNVYFGTFGTPTPTGNPYLPNSSLLAATQGAQFIQKDHDIWNKDTNNFAPRFGFSYDSLGNGKLVVRGGFGIGYDRLFNNVYENLRFNYPRFVDNAYGPGAGIGNINESLRAAIVQTPFTGNVALSVAGAAPVPRHIDQRLVTAYYEQAHLGFETAIARGYVLEANYIGTFGRKLVGLMNINTFEGRVACPVRTTPYPTTNLCYAATPTHLGFSSARPTTQFGNDNFRTNGFGSNYSGGQVSLRKGFASGLQLLANYTFSKAMDDISDVFNAKSGGSGQVPTPYNVHHNYGAADFDTRHTAVMTINYQPEWKKNNLLLGGWGLSTITQLHSGTPIYISNNSSSYDLNKDGTSGVERAVYLGTGSLKNSINHNISPAGDGVSAGGFIKAGSWGKYVCPVSVNGGLFCDAPGDRNPLYGPSFLNVDLGISKRFQIHERYTARLQADFFDVMNRSQFGNPVGDSNSTSFGKSLSATNREGQLSARFEF